MPWRSSFVPLSRGVFDGVLGQVRGELGPELVLRAVGGVVVMKRVAVVRAFCAAGYGFALEWFLRGGRGEQGDVRGVRAKGECCCWSACLVSRSFRAVAPYPPTGMMERGECGHTLRVECIPDQLVVRQHARRELLHPIRPKRIRRLQLQGIIKILLPQRDDFEGRIDISQLHHWRIVHQEILGASSVIL